MSNAAPPTIIIDTDALIALFFPSDKHSTRAVEILEGLYELQARLVCPATTVVEAVTTFQIRLGSPHIAASITGHIMSNEFLIEPINQEIIRQALLLFKPDGSKKNTLFDAIVAALAQKYSARAIFSFDEWYKKIGFTLAKDVIP